MEQSTNSLPPGFVLKGNHNYTIKETINQGGFGIIYRAEAEFMDHHIPQMGIYAIKEFFPDGLCHRSEDQSVIANEGKKKMFKESYEEFKAEADCLYELHHKGIVPVNEVVETNGTVYYVMKYLDGKALDDYMIERGGHLSEAEAVSIASKVGEALGYLHRDSILHLDVKPDNIIMVGNEPVLIDFGSYRKFKTNGQLSMKQKGICVSDGYSPLEQYEGIENFSPKADVYALGATLYAMLTGETPIEAKEMSKKWIYNNIPEEVSETVIDALCDAMAKLPVNRTESVSKFVTALHGTVLGNVPKGRGGTRRLEDVIAEQKRKRTRMGLLAAVFLAACITAFFLLRPSKPTPSPNGPKVKVVVNDTASKKTITTDQKQEKDTQAVQQPKTQPQKEQSIIQPASINLYPASVTLEKGKSVNLKPILSPNNATTTLTWSSSNNGVSIVNASGHVVAQNQGDATITCQTSNGLTARCQITVPAPQEPVSKKGKLDLGYAVWEGDIANGLPDGNGMMSFKSSHLIESRDINKNVASPGDRVSGSYKKGHLVYGTWTKSNGEREKLLIGE